MQIQNITEGNATQSRVIQAIEEERNRLAREIHDGPAQILSNAVFELEYCERILDRDPQALREALLQLKGEIRAGLDEVRRFMFDLRPPVLAEQGLSAAIRRYVQGFESRYGIGIEFHDETGFEGRIDSSLELAVFRIIQEALQNVHKHSDADRASVRLSYVDGTLGVEIEDKGRGFEQDNVPQGEGRHMGIKGMRERAELVQGILETFSAPGHGTIVRLSVPVGPE